MRLIVRWEAFLIDLIISRMLVAVTRLRVVIVP